MLRSHLPILCPSTSVEGVMDVGTTYIASWSPLMTDGRGNDLVGGVDDMGEGKVG